MSCDIPRVIDMADVEPVDPVKASKFSRRLEKWQLEHGHLFPEEYHRKKMIYMKKLEEELGIREEDY